MKKILAMLVVLTMVFCLVGCSGGESGPDLTDEANGKPIKIGALLELSGAYAAMGRQSKIGMEMALDHYNWTAAGRPIEIVYADVQSDSSIAVQMAQKLIEREGCKIILGPESGSCALAVKELAGSFPEITFVMNGGAEDQTMRTVYSNVFRTCTTGAQSIWALGEYAVKELGFKRFVTVGPDNDFQYTQIAGFTSTATLAGGEIVDRLWFPESGNDFSSLIAQIPTDVDAVLLTAGGANGADFCKQYKEYGLKMPILGGHSVVDPSSTHIPEIGSALEGTYGSTSTPTNIEGNELFEEIEKTHQEKLGFAPSVLTIDPYVAVQVAIETLNSTDGNLDDVENFQKVMKETVYKTPRGEFKFDDYGQGVFTIYITQVKKDPNSDGYLNEAIATFKNQTQFGPFDPDWYQAQPSPSRDNPTIETIKNAKLAE